MFMQELLRKIKEDDESAFNELYFRYFNPLIHFSYSFVNNRDIAEEIVNDVFLRLWLKRKTLPDISNEKVFLYTAARNASLNHLRTFSTKRFKNMESFLTSDQHILVEFSPEQYYISAETKSRIVKAVNSLPPKCQIIYKMVKEDGLSIAEAAEILLLSYKTVFTQLQIALKKIAAVIE